MYKLFLCLRYLRSRVIAYFAVLGVALCVAMMLIATSVMNGFLNKIEKAAKGLFGDIVIEARTTGGVGLYDEFISEVKKQSPEVQDASPFIISHCFLKIPNSTWNAIVQVAGIRLPERAKVTDFAKGLFVQTDWPDPTFDPPAKAIAERLAQEANALFGIFKRYETKGPADPDIPWRLAQAEHTHLDSGLRLLKSVLPVQETMARLQAELDQAYARSHGEPTEATDAIEKQLDDLKTEANYLPPSYHVILGLGIPGLSFRTAEGETVRYIVPGEKVSISLIPLGQLSIASSISLNTKVFTIVDDCRTDVSSIDENIVYVPFETLQLMNDMQAKPDPTDPNRVAIPARCNQIHLKLRGSDLSERQLEPVREKIERAWEEFRSSRPELAGADVSILTWRQRQRDVIEPIERQRTLTVIMFGIISLVSVVLIFVIFYMIVFQKTKDIGVLKAVGASSGGVAGIFLAYGAAVGLVGSVLGTVGGYYFVRYINEIQDFIDKYFRFRVWDRKWFMFEKIPNEVELVPALLIVAGAIAAGILGALVPAIRAARMQPVEALRYE